MYVVMNVLNVPAAGKDKMKEMFGKSADSMMQVPGCIEFMFLDSNEEDKIVVFTKWDNKESFEAWTQSESFRRAHSERRTEGSTATGNKLETYTVVHNTK